MRRLMDLPVLQRLAIPGVTALVAFLAFTSQLLFHHLEPGPLPTRDAYRFNLFVACIFICYWRTCLTDPGKIPRNWLEDSQVTGSGRQQAASKAAAQSNRWCRRCEMFKPPRAHHCKTCNR
jgi:palmitoyltransferase